MRSSNFFWLTPPFLCLCTFSFSESSLSPTGSPSPWSSFLLERREPTKGGWDHSGPYSWPMESTLLPILAGQALVFKRPKYPGDTSEEKIFPTLPPSSIYHSLCSVKSHQMKMTLSLNFLYHRREHGSFTHLLGRRLSWKFAELVSRE